MAASTRAVVRTLSPVFLALVLACHGGPSSPSTSLPVGRWTGQGACLAVAEAQCNLAAGCGHGQFPRPAVRADGTFDVDGTYRIEIGPVSVDPPPPAHFSGSIKDDVVILTVVLSGGTLPRATYTLRSTTTGGCPVPCV
jgi:hypothetical protein